MAKDARLMIRLEQADLDWIKEEADKIGLDAATFVRSMIRKARNGLAPPIYQAVTDQPEQILPGRVRYADDYREIDHPAPADHSGPIEIDIDALAAQESPADAFPVARPGDMDAVRPVGQRYRRDEIMPSFGRK